ncbi:MULTISPECIES: hypothetical protein [Amycolatopsis]|uniref:DUF2637 domain-containing protein n=1 Tax=Amycolatopsis thermalba TaxID=944492 RepID=A0ABY4NPQ9_9PSEU|nr:MULTISPECIES: hypothetical protein [Amycolatopsis]OXM74545.1 hypothetical protein CF166_04275 [Amycolatopsis sp. KNN50.9b]UQS21756.1 hypothetical protein L1857_02410 [Amycolatopsis thermalba]
MSWYEERRENKRTEAMIRREDAAAAAQVRIAERQAAAQIKRADAQARREAQQQATAARRARRAAVVRGLRLWLGRHVVELLIYPIALLSFVLAAPAMARYGIEVFASELGALLPGITEFGMWAFAIAVVIERRRHPDRSVWGLVAGVLVFGAVAFGINFTHGLTTAWDHGVVMGTASIAGVVAHQLTLATAPKSGQQRREARIERAAARKVARIRKAAVKRAVAEIEADGSARLLYAPGRYTLTRRGLKPATVPGLPVAESTDWDRELADLLATTGAATATGVTPSIEGEQEPGDSIEGGSVATLDHGPDLHESSPDRPVIDRKPGRSMEQLRAELAAAIEAGTVNPRSAESIRKTLRVSAARARQLRDEHTKGGRK